mmetsp:Transcript_50047/g.82967  ORF Transcript_50047/g.82967 Transcript_50047/m.82967 type:complete len:248 (-) Transcript_50047:54-797(-)
MQNLIKEGRQLLFIERREAAEEDVEDDSRRPNVDSARVVAFILEDLGSDVAGCATCSFHHVLRGHHPRQTEVRHLDSGIIIFIAVQDILRFQIAVHYVSFMQILESVAKGEHSKCSVFLFVVTLGHYPIEELAARDQLHDEVHLLLLVVNLIERDYVCVLDLEHDLDLTLNVPHILDLGLVNDLDCDSFLICQRRVAFVLDFYFMFCFDSGPFDNSEISTPKLFTQLISRGYRICLIEQPHKLGRAP